MHVNIELYVLMISRAQLVILITDREYVIYTYITRKKIAALAAVSFVLFISNSEILDRKRKTPLPKSHSYAAK